MKISLPCQSAGFRFQMLVKEIEHALLRLLAAAVGHVPEFRLDVIAGALTLPGVVHDAECLLHTGNGEKLVLRAIDEEHGFGTGDAGDMRIV